MFSSDSKVTTLLHPLPSSVEHVPSPQKFTYPFFYEPHALCVAAVEEIKPVCRRLLEGENGGKMFGVLVVEKEEKGIAYRYYLAAFSGIIQGTYLHPGFVPPIYNLQHPGSYFQEEQAAISAINKKIEEGADDPALFEERKQRSHNLQYWLFQQFHVLNGLGVEVELPELFKNEKRILTEEEFYRNKQKSPTLTRLSNPPAIGSSIPSGSGECCAPKLLQYAYSQGLKPLCMAEFWLGPSPKDEPRIDGNYYPACHAKCRPILRHMLQGLVIEENPMLRRNREMVAQVKWIYEDNDIAVLNKPSGLLTSPGKDDVPSLLDVVKEKYPEAMYAHRLDMDTSGIVVFALNESAYKHLQQQFYHHEVTKYYMALLEGEVSTNIPDKGTIRLPLLPNPFDRPRQMVNHEHGKQAITHYEIIERKSGRTLIKFNPQTGRTHQLRVHSAHCEGLNSPIVGDNLYGSPSDRLYLHAEYISFTHPVTGEKMEFQEKMI